MKGIEQLQSAWLRRERISKFPAFGAIRVFHGPGEGTGDLRDVSIDRYSSGEEHHFWVTLRSGLERIEKELVSFLREKQRGTQSVVATVRGEGGQADAALTLWGDPPAELSIQEGLARFWIRLRGERHSGLFLDHRPLRSWLVSNTRGLEVLNTFAYTGSLSICAGLGAARHVTHLDLSRPANEWAKQNWALNQLPDAGVTYVHEDVFEFFPFQKKRGRVYDCVILDPPSFSRGKKGSFSTAKDLPRLHALALGVLRRPGILVTSINSANIPEVALRLAIQGALREQKLQASVLRRISVPETFPLPFADTKAEYLKGFVLLVKPNSG